jgi:hypothetical protein
LSVQFVTVAFPEFHTCAELVLTTTAPFSTHPTRSPDLLRPSTAPPGTLLLDETRARRLQVSSGRHNESSLQGGGVIIRVEVSAAALCFHATGLLSEERPAHALCYVRQHLLPSPALVCRAPTLPAVPPLCFVCVLAARGEEAGARPWQCQPRPWPQPGDGPDPVLQPRAEHPAAPAQPSVEHGRGAQLTSYHPAAPHVRLLERGSTKGKHRLFKLQVSPCALPDRGSLLPWKSACCMYQHVCCRTVLSAALLSPAQP